MFFQLSTYKFNLILKPLLVIILLCFTCYSKVNSKEHSDVKQNWIDIQIQHADELSINDPTLAIEFVEQLLIHKSSKISVVDIAKFKIHLIENYLLVDKLNKSKILIEEIDKVSAQLDTKTQIAFLLLKSTHYSYLTENALAESMLVEAEYKSQLIKDSKLLGHLYHIKGEFYRNNSDNIQAIEAYLKAYKLMKKDQNFLNIAYLESSMAKSYAALYDFDTAISLMSRSLKYFDQHNLHFDRSVTHYYLARFFIKNSQPVLALKHISIQLKVNQNLKSANFNYYAYLYKAKAHFDLGELESARSSLNLIIPYVNELKSTYNIANYYFTKAEIEISEGKLIDAFASLSFIQEKVQSMSDEKDITLKLNLYRLLSLYYNEMKAYKQAHYYKQKYIDMNETYNGYIREAARARQQVMFDIKKVKFQNELLERDKKINELELEEAKRHKELQLIIIGCILFVLASLFVFTARQVRLRKIFSHLANTDALTKISSRLKIMSILELTWEREACHNLCLISFDIDHFKKVNDTFGHQAGDIVLQELTRTASKTIGSNNSIGRIGGEEFLVILLNTSLQTAQDVANRIRQDIENLDIFYNEQLIKVTASFGVVDKNSQQASYKEMLKLVDNLLYQAKKLGRNRVEIHHQSQK